MQVSGPAAGLTVVVAELVNRFGWQATTAIVAGAGVLQIGFGLSRLGRFAQAIPPAVVHGMLAGIGGTIVLSQLHVLLGGQPQSGALDSLRELPAQFVNAHGPAVVVGLVTVGLMLAWPRLPGVLRSIPAALVAVVAATALASVLDPVLGSAARVELPSGLLAAISLPVLPDGQWAALAVGVLTVALVASVESLLSAVAVDHMHQGPRAKADRELIGQGAANTLSGLFGGLPVTGVIVRSATNVRAGAKTRAAAVLHAVWIAVFAVGLVWMIELVPLAALAGLLVVVGGQLVKVADLRTARQHGELVLYLVTTLGVMAFNLLEGSRSVWRWPRCWCCIGRCGPGCATSRHWSATSIRVTVEGAATFPVCVPALSRALAAIPAGAPTRRWISLRTMWTMPRTPTCTAGRTATERPERTWWLPITEGRDLGIKSVRHMMGPARGAQAHTSRRPRRGPIHKRDQPTPRKTEPCDARTWPPLPDRSAHVPDTLR